MKFRIITGKLIESHVFRGKDTFQGTPEERRRKHIIQSKVWWWPFWMTHGYYDFGEFFTAFYFDTIEEAKETITNNIQRIQQEKKRPTVQHVESADI